MKLNLLENLIVWYWFLLDINAYNDFKYWKEAGLQTKYAFQKVYKKL